MIKENCILLLMVLTGFCVADEISGAQDQLRDPKTARKGVYQLKKVIRAPKSKRNEHDVARAILALGEFYRKEEPATLKDYVEPYSALKTQNLAYPRVEGFSEYCRYLARLEQNSQALQLLRKSIDKTKGLPKVILMEARSDCYRYIPNFKDCISGYKAALSLGKRHFTQKKISTSGDKEPKKADHKYWKGIKSRITAKLKTAERDLRIHTYGKDYVLYEEAGELHRKGSFKEASSKYSQIIEEFRAGNIYAEASEFYRCLCTKALKGDKPAFKALTAFIKKNPQGLYRGKAQYELAMIHFLGRRKISSALKQITAGLGWVNQRKYLKHSQTIFPVPQKSKQISQPPAVSQYIYDEVTVVAKEIKPGQLVNCQTARWYLPWLEKEFRYLRATVLMTTFSWEKAQQELDKVLGLDKELRTLQALKYTNSYHRLQMACEFNGPEFYEYEMKKLNLEQRCLITYAGVRYLREDFASHKYYWKKVHREAGKKKSNPIMPYYLIASSKFANKESGFKNSISMLKKHVSQYNRHVTSARAYFYLGNVITSSLGDKYQQASNRYYTKAIALAPADSYIEESSRLALAVNYAFQGSFTKAKETASELDAASKECVNIMINAKKGKPKDE